MISMNSALLPGREPKLAYTGHDGIKPDLPLRPCAFFAPLR
jgi:hypothetical protein